MMDDGVSKYGLFGMLHTQVYKPVEKGWSNVFNFCDHYWKKAFIIVKGVFYMEQVDSRQLCQL